MELDEFFLDDCPAPVRLAGKSKSMRESLHTIRVVAQSRCNPVLIVGETGTGKEQAALAVHVLRGGSREDFLAVNCAALTANLLESELFGHVRGAFTGADREKTGLFEAAGTGTIYLDEISEMPLELQAKLLRVIQERRFRKVGGTKDILCHATIIASSNRGLLGEVEAGHFRKDLYYRLAVFPISMPSLRDAGRQSDIPILARYFLRTSNICDREEMYLSPAAEQFLLSHDWPGNVRELRNVMDRAMILQEGEEIEARNIIIDRPETEVGDGAVPTEEKDFSLETAEKEFILRALQETGWQRTRAASLLGITRATLHSKLKKYDITPPEAGNDTDEADPSETPQAACA
jgi:transcriptional regulator with PAS, ATPase and Fis domain